MFQVIITIKCPSAISIISQNRRHERLENRLPVGMRVRACSDFIELIYLLVHLEVVPDLRKAQMVNDKVK